jgi:hypothetical protein
MEQRKSKEQSEGSFQKKIASKQKQGAIQFVGDKRKPAPLCQSSCAFRARIKSKAEEGFYGALNTAKAHMRLMSGVTYIIVGK